MNINNTTFILVNTIVGVFLIETYGGNSIAYSSITKLIATSCKTGARIEQIVQEIASQIDAIPPIKDLLPNSCVQIKTPLEVIGKDYNYFLRKCVGFHVLNQSKF
ncbi:hypothetical protein EZJ55_15525 [Microcystis aeruginosa EAWAG127a]|uniref:Uncharacterized protein n=1 Tax=Microcystis aeruginosa EAWAG127a TaxID=2529855 RepID=A0A5J5LX84_MICAE|nr:hypothetical protein [Microcystis aeruginosa]KAB0241756.1 hypothetical protein EZJ55_15525 [Microcystis aeruginosa EAWAG127a]